ncbi:MAG: mechanosensitive ion channel family protein, partial [Anaerolineae bacterium]
MDLGIPLETFMEEAIRFVPRLISAIIVFIISLFLSALATRWARRAAESRIDDPETLYLLSRIARWTVIVLGTLIALDQVDFDVTGFVAGLGIAGVTIGFAMQDITRNFVAGILLLIRQPFDIGDGIEVASYSGTVLDITTRDTVLKTWDGEMVIIPNLDVFTSPILNYSDMPNRRRTVHIGLGYGEDTNRAIRLFLEAVQGVEGVLADPAPTMLAEELGDSAMIFAARFWVNQETHSLFTVHSEVVQAINQVGEEEGIDLPYPVQTVR